MPINRLFDKGKDSERNAKKMAKTRLKARITAILLPIIIKLVVIFLLVTVVSTIIGGFVKIIRGEVFEWGAASTAKLEELEVINTEEKCLNLSDEVVDELIQTLIDNGLNVSKLKMLGENEEELEAEEITTGMRKYIREYYAAELITQYPDMSDKPGDSASKRNLGEYIKDIIFGGTEKEREIRKYKYQGCITLIKPDEEGNVTLENDKVTNQYLKYKTETEFNQALNNANILGMRDANVLNYFTVSGNNIKVAGYTIVDESVSYYATSVNFKAIASAYTMPMEFLLMLNLYTENPEYTYALARLVEDSRIVLAVQYNYSKNEQNEVKETEYWTEPTTEIEYRKDAQGNVMLDAQGKPIIQSQTEIPGHWSGEIETTTNTTITESYTPSVQLVLADTWIVKKQVSYKKKAEEPTSETNTEAFENAEQSRGQVTTTTTNKDSYSFVEDTGNTKEEEKTKIVLGLLQNKEGTYDPDNLLEFDPENRKEMKYVQYQIPFTDITRNPTGHLRNAKMMIDDLEKNESTQNQAEIMKYLMNVYFNTEQFGGATSFDQLKDLFVTKTFMNVAGGDELTKQFIRQFEGCKEKDGKYLVYLDTQKIPTVGYGVNIREHRQDFINAGVSSEQLEPGGLIDKEIVNQIEDSIRTKYREEIINGLAAAGITLKEFQIDALTSRAYNCGVDGALNRSYNAEEGFLTACKKYWSEADEQIGEPETNSMYQHLLYTKCMRAPTNPGTDAEPGLIRRRKAEWLLFKTGCYSDGAGTIYGYWSEEESLAGDATAVLQKADEIMKYMQNHGYAYCTGGKEDDTSHNGYGGPHGLNTSFEASKTGYHLTCCATYVSWVLMEAGYDIQCEHNSTELSKKLAARFERIEKYADLQPGDIAFLEVKTGRPYSHVQIYAGNGRWYNAGGNSQIAESPKLSTPTKIFTAAFRPN